MWPTYAKGSIQMFQIDAWQWFDSIELNSFGKSEKCGLQDVIA